MVSPHNFTCYCRVASRGGCFLQWLSRLRGVNGVFEKYYASPHFSFQAQDYDFYVISIHYGRKTPFLLPRILHMKVNFLNDAAQHSRETVLASGAPPHEGTVQCQCGR